MIDRSVHNVLLLYERGCRLERTGVASRGTSWRGETEAGGCGNVSCAGEVGWIHDVNGVTDGRLRRGATEVVLQKVSLTKTPLVGT